MMRKSSPLIVLFAPIIAFLIAFLALPNSLDAQTDPRFSELNQTMVSGELGPLRSLLIQRGDELIHQAYFHDGHPDQFHDLYSVTKSFGATLIGMAERRGLLTNQALVQEFFPEYNWQVAPLAAHADLDLSHVLTMRHGLDWDEWSYPYPDPRNSYFQMLPTPDWYLFTLSQARLEPPGSSYRYSTGISNLMSRILADVSGMSPDQVFRQWLAEPLGIENFGWRIDPDGCHGNTTCDFPFDEVPMGVGLTLRSIDLLRLGELYLNRGTYGGQRLLDEDWIDRAWTTYSDGDSDPTVFGNSLERWGYGYQWWFVEFHDSRDRKISCWYAAGSGRQYLFICPLLDLIVVSNSFPTVDYTGPGIGFAMREHILPTFDPPVHPSFAGSYYNPEYPGQGVTIQIWPDSGVIWFKWFTYRDGQPQWYVGMGNIIGDEIVIDELLTADHGEFLSNLQPDVYAVGSVRLRWQDCHSAELHYQIGTNEGVYPLDRLTGHCNL